MDRNGAGWLALAKIIKGYGGNSVSIKTLSSDKFIKYSVDDHTFEIQDDLLITTSKTGVNVTYYDLGSIVAVTLM